MGKREEKQIEAGIAAAKDWNEKHPAGTRVKYFPIAGEPEFDMTQTRSEAWILGHGEPVVKINGCTGGVALSHLEVLP